MRILQPFAFLSLVAVFYSGSISAQKTSPAPEPVNLPAVQLPAWLSGADGPPMRDPQELAVVQASINAIGGLANICCRDVRRRAD